MAKQSVVQERLQQIAEKCEEHPDVSEKQLRRYFDQSNLLEEALGYSEEEIKVGETIKDRKETDIHCTDEYGNVTFVLEFKKPSVSIPGSHLSQLRDRYMNPLRADYGVLYNGKRWLLYERIGDECRNVIDAKTRDIGKQATKKIFAHLEKPDYDTKEIDRVLSYFRKFEEEQDRLELVEEASRHHFYQNFRLETNSAFGNLLEDTISLFSNLREDNYKFLNSAYEFWRKSYAKSPDSVPDNWKPLMDSAGLTQKEEDLYTFMFCLESTYALFARLILAKSGEDYGFPDVRFSQFVESRAREASFRDDIAQVSWAKITLELIRDMRGKLVTSVFEEDIFYWWTEPFENMDFRDPFHGKTSREMGRFGNSLARILLMLYKFNFSEITGDPLGILYQQYFDKQTRKALGEFYTPQEVVDYILDSVGYSGRKILDKRLLDPACGSGTFLVTALQRYLEASEQRAEQIGWDRVLKDLCNKYRIVGFDVHPFATIMSQIQFMMVLLPYYRRAIENDPHFVLERVPIFRTDSLLKENSGGQLRLLEYNGGQKVSMTVELPVRGEKDDFFRSQFEMPEAKTVRKETDIHNNEEYFGVLQALFDVVKRQANKLEQEKSPPQLDVQAFERSMRAYLSNKNWNRIASFFEPFANDVLDRFHTLQSEFDDGRLVKSIEDIFLAALLKTQHYDYVVGNPPYVRIQNLPEEQKDLLGKTYKSSTGNYDLYCPFIERGIEWLTESGRLGYITPNQFMVTDYGKGIRDVLLSRVRIEELFDFRDSGVFKDVTNYPVILTLAKEQEDDVRQNNDFRGIRVKANVDEESGRELDDEVITRVRNNRSNAGYTDDIIDIFRFPQDSLDTGYWPVCPPKEHRVLKKLEEDTNTRIGDVTEAVFQGIRTSANKVYVVEVLDADRVKSDDSGGAVTIAPTGGSGTFEIEKDLLRPFLQGDEVKRWRGSWSGLHVVHPYYARENQEGALETGLYSQKKLQNDLPGTWEFFKAHKERLESRESGRKEGKDDWYGYIYPKNLDKFEHPKIIQQEISEKSTYMLDEFGTWYFTTGYGITMVSHYRDITNELAVQLNSNVLDFYIKHIAAVKAGGFYSYRTQYVEKLPCILNDDNGTFDRLQKKLTEIVNRIDEVNKLNRFPAAYISDAEVVSKTVTMDAGHSDIAPEVNEREDAGYDVVIGKRKKENPFVVDTREKANFICKALQGRNVSKGETVEVLVPKNNRKVKEILESYESDRERLENMPTVSDLEEQINKQVYELFNLDEEDIEVIESFLDQF